MSKSTLNTIVKLGALAAVVYGAYKLGEYQAKKSVNVKPESRPQLAFDEVPNKNEEDYVSKLINDLRNKPNKTQKDRNNIELLEVKLKQIRNK
jgi:uncharacterized membrane protein YebE (DUF533 family)